MREKWRWFLILNCAQFQWVRNEHERRFVKLFHLQFFFWNSIWSTLKQREKYNEMGSAKKFRVVWKKFFRCRVRNNKSLNCGMIEVLMWKEMEAFDIEKNTFDVWNFNDRRKIFTRFFYKGWRLLKSFCRVMNSFCIYICKILKINLTFLG